MSERYREQQAIEAKNDAMLDVERMHETRNKDLDRKNHARAVVRLLGEIAVLLGALVDRSE